MVGMAVVHAVGACVGGGRAAEEQGGGESGGRRRRGRCGRDGGGRGGDGAAGMAGHDGADGGVFLFGAVGLVSVDFSDRGWPFPFGLVEGCSTRRPLCTYICAQSRWTVVDGVVSRVGEVRTRGLAGWGRPPLS